MKIIFGLGNPGKKYEFTRHNTGFLMVDYYASEYGFDIKKLKHRALIGEHNHKGEKILFVKPQTFMNLSGECVREIVDYYKIENNDILIIYDDISLNLGRIRIRGKGTDGGHNGIKNIIFKLNSDVFPRVKIGISNFANCETIDYVLSPFSKEELKILREIAKININVVNTFLDEGTDSAMNKFNGINLEVKDN